MQQKHQSERELVDDKITGVSIFIRNPIGAAAVKDIESALMVAMVFGVTSPKISIKNVRIPVAIPAPVFPKDGWQGRLKWKMPKGSQCCFRSEWQITFSRISGYTQYPCSAFIAIVCKGTHTNLVYGCKSCL